MKELKQYGDTGIGTFDKLNGELIMLDGEVYRAAGDGRVEIVSDDETIPFSVVTFMDADEIIRSPLVGGVDPGRQAGGVGGAQQGIPRGTGEPHLEVGVSPQSGRQLLPDGVDQVLLAKSVPFRSGICS